MWQTGVHNFPGGREGSAELLGVLGPFEGSCCLGLRPWGRPWEPCLADWSTQLSWLEGSPELLEVLGPFEGAKRQFRKPQRTCWGFWVGAFWTRPWRLRPWKPYVADWSTQLSWRTQGLCGTFRGFGALWRCQATVSQPYRTSCCLGLRPWGRPWEPWQTGVHNFPGSAELLEVLGPFEGAKR